MGQRIIGTGAVGAVSKRRDDRAPRPVVIQEGHTATVTIE